MAAAFFVPSYHSLFAGAGALAILAAVVIGFAVRPRDEIFYVRTTTFAPASAHLSTEYDCLAVRVEVGNLWLLFLPTVGAVAVLLLIFARGSGWWLVFWNLRPLQVALENAALFVIQAFDLLLLGVIGLLSRWLSERWMLRDAEACSANSTYGSKGRVYYSFKDSAGGYFGGYGFPITRDYPRELATIVLYSASNPDLNRLSQCCLFHGLTVVGRGVADLDEATVAGASTLPRPGAQGRQRT